MIHHSVDLAWGWMAARILSVAQVTVMAEWVRELLWNGFAVLAGSASIAGLIISVWVLRRVGRIEAGFTRQALLPVYVKKLGGSIKNLKCHQKAKDTEKILLVLTICRTTLDDLLELLDGKRAEHVTRVICSIEKLPSDDALNQCGVFIAELEAVRETLGNLMQEMQWRGRNG